jgi:predicted ATPase
VTSFIGRDPDVASLSEALRDQPVMTVTGPGGVGKTRLAMRVAGAVIDAFDDGVTVVEFAPLRDPSGVAQVIAHALDIQQRQYRTIESTIEDHLASTNCLLVLDNCEHVAETVAPLVDRLRSSCPRLRILATSREPLGLAGEYVEVLDPLSLPATDAVTAEEVRGSAAVELFVSRARAATRGFTLTDDNAAVVADICRRLDGLPLAVELAAARLRSMGIDSLAERLNQRTELLGQTQRGADGRQRTLHHLVEWSHDLLAPLEQEVFEQLAVFAGGFDLSAAEAICSIEGAATPTLGTLAGLVEKSMVVFVDPGPPRYRLLEPLREFGLDRLREHGTLEAVEDRHLGFFVDLAERGAAGIDSPDEASWSAALDRDLDNFRAAHLTALRRDDADSALRLVVSLYEFGFRRVLYEVESWADASAALAGARGHPDRPTVLAVSAYGRFVRGDMETAISLALEAIDDAGPSDSGLAERVLGNTHFYMEHIEEGVAWMDKMSDSARRADSKARIAHGLYMRSVAETSVGGGIRGAVLAGEAKAAADVVRSPTAQAQADYALGLALEGTDPSEALSRLERASVVAAEAGNRWIQAFALTEVYWLKARRGEHLAALIGYGDVVDTWYRGGDWANQWLSLRRVLGILIDLGALEAAAVLHGSLTAVGASNALPFEPAVAERISENVARLRSLLGPAAFADAVRRGASMKDGEIVSFVEKQIAALTGEGPSSASEASPDDPT